MIQGRGRELGVLEAALARAFDGHAGRLLLVGEAGMGKSALLDTLARRARRRGVCVVRAAAPEGSDATPFGVIEDLARGLGDALGALPDEDAEVLRGLPRTAESRPGEVAVALLHLLAEAAHNGPLLVLVDDLHWADPGSLTALCLAVGRLQSEQVAVVAAARPRPPLDPRPRSWPTLDVGPLDDTCAVALLRTVLPAALQVPDGQARTVAVALGCCPLAIVEAPRLLSPSQLTGADPLPDPLPLDDRLTQAWAAAWAGLPEPAAEALLALCVARGSGWPLVSAVWSELGVGPDDLAPALETRLATGLVTAAGTTADLAHPLIRDAILATAGPDRVRAMHRVAARAAEPLGLASSILVAHLAAAAAQGDRGAVEELEHTADDALAEQLVEPAAQALVAAAALAEGAERSRLAARAAQVKVLYAGDTSSDQILDMADPSMLPPDDRLWVEWLRAETLGDLNIREHLIALDAATSTARRTGSPVAQWTLMSAIDAAWRLQDRAAASAHAQALLDWLDHDYHEPDALVPAWACRVWIGVTEFQVGHVATAHDLLTAARQESRTWQAPDGDPALERGIIAAEEYMGYLDPWVDARLAGAARLYARDPGEMLGFAREFQAERARRRGDLLRARALVDDGLAMARAAGSSLGVAYGLVTTAAIAAAQGDRATHDRASAEANELARGNGDRSLETRISRAAGLLALGEGRLDEALAQLEPLAEDLLLGFGPWDAVPMGRADLVEALVRCGEAERAAHLARDLARTLDPSPDAAARAIVDRVRGLVAASHQSAAAALSLAIAAFDEASDPFEAARTRLLLGERLRRDRHIQPARHELRVATAAFDRMGSPVWADRARAELRATRAAVPMPVPDALGTLTPQERRVAEAVATGASDRQVAADLFLSHRTVAYHLSSIYRKLGVSNRAALAARLASGPAGVVTG